MRYTNHARLRMTERGITTGDVEAAVSRPVGDPDAGSFGSIVTTGEAPGGRRLKVVRSAADPELVISLYWVDRPGRYAT